GGECVIRISKENYTGSDRKIISVPGFSTAVFDSRLAPLTGEETMLTPAGGVIKSTSGQAVTSGGSLYRTGTLTPGGIKGIVIYPENAVESEKTATMTFVGPQALQGRPPSGWSPLAAFDIRVKDVNDNNININSFLRPCLLRLVNRWPGVAVSSMTLGYWDENTGQWVCASAISISPEEMTGTIEKPGQYAFLIKDSSPVVPPHPIKGQPIPGVSIGSIPTDITTKLVFYPTTIYPGDIARALLTINSRTTPGVSAVVSSGVPVQARIKEKYE
ncbi:MAG: hypothetical protein GTO60_14065, partial [Gammaproteobacteria bacterium]|nr:hypothetical protein [Gammaproteobacteria bacterium]NIO61833.1 hypothetical protein [Gammaproteobacteria bacterium]